MTLKYYIKSFKNSSQNLITSAIGLTVFKNISLVYPEPLLLATSEFKKNSNTFM